MDKFLSNNKIMETVDNAIIDELPLSLKTYKYCRCSIGSQYAITPQTCKKCKKWRWVFNYYTENYKSNVNNNNLIITNFYIYTIPCITLNGYRDMFSTLVMGVYIMNKIDKRYPELIDAWRCGDTGSIVKRSLLPFSESFKDVLPSDITNKFIKHIDILSKYNYKPSYYSYHRVGTSGYNSFGDINSISDILSYDELTRTICLPIPMSISHHTNNSEYNIYNMDMCCDITLEHIKEYISIKYYLNE